MHAQSEAVEILERWHHLTRREASAIDTAAWSDLRQIQIQKKALREEFAAAADRCAAEGVPMNPLRAKAARIVSLLNRNAKALDERMRDLRRQQGALREQRRNLVRVQRSYLRPARTGRLRVLT